jgi:hypothetical protein
MVFLDIERYFTKGSGNSTDSSDRARKLKSVCEGVHTMEHLQGLVEHAHHEIPPGLAQSKAASDAKIIEATLSHPGQPSATVEFSFDELYKSLSVAGQKMIDELNKILKDSVPNGIQSLDPQEMTPEKTAERIVNGVSGLFPGFADQNPELEGEELVDAFMKAVTRGVDQGYGEAVEILEGLGAFEFSGVKDSVEETRGFIDTKLAGLENSLRQRLGLGESGEAVTDEVAANISSGLSSQAGASTLRVAA